MSRFEEYGRHGYSPRWDLADRLRNRFDVESYDVYEFHGDNNGDPDSGASDDQTSVSGAAGASQSLPDCAPEDEACHPHRAFQSYPYPGYGPSVPPGYPHGPFVEPDMGWEPAPPPSYGGGGGYQHRDHRDRGGFFDRFRRRFGGQPAAPYGGGYGGQPGAPPPPMGMGGIGQPAPPPQMGMNSWARWQQIHPGSSYQDYQNWWNQYGSQGASINGEVQFGGEGGLGDEDLCGGFDLHG